MDKESKVKVSSYSRIPLNEEGLWEEKKSFLYLICSAILVIFLGVMVSDNLNVLGLNSLNWNIFAYMLVTAFYVFILVLTFPKPKESIKDFIVVYILLFITGLLLQEFTVKSFKDLGNANTIVLSFLSLYTMIWSGLNFLNKRGNIKSIPMFSFIFTFGFFFAFFHDDLSFLINLPIYLSIFYYVLITLVISTVSFLYFMISDPKLQLLTSSIALFNLVLTMLLFLFGFYIAGRI